MFSNQEKLYTRNKSSLARWSTARKAITAYTAVPASVSIWQFVMSPDLKELFSYLVIIVAVVILQIVCAGKEAHYESVVSLLKARLDHPPNKSEDLQSGRNSTKLLKRNHHGNG